MLGKEHVAFAAASPNCCDSDFEISTKTKLSTSVGLHNGARATDLDHHRQMTSAPGALVNNAVRGYWVIQGGL